MTLAPKPQTRLSCLSSIGVLEHCRIASRCTLELASHKHPCVVPLDIIPYAG